MKNSSKFFSNSQCEFFPCHKCDNAEDFNCLFCYCPLYPLGKDCGGTFDYLPNGYKDCSRCLYPHKRENYDTIVQRYQEILAVMHTEPEDEEMDEAI